jgi:eukaryotic-like serine/threonine-protein kinase
MLRVGDRIGDWIVETPLGEGGMGAVYRVHSALTQRLAAALKVMKPSAEADSRHRFVREAEALAALRHPAVVRVMEFAEDAPRGLLYLVMELALGLTLRERVAQGPMGVREALGVFLPLAQGLDHAHLHGVYHRDIKPANIILCEDGSVRLVDFGIAAADHAGPITQTGQMGTLAYLPPEVFRGEHAEPAGLDVYGFGLVLHEALTGTRSFSVEPGLTPPAAAAAVGVRKLQSEPMELPESFNPRLRELVRATTAPDPAQRPRMAAVRSALETLVERRGGGEANRDTGARLVPLGPAASAYHEHTMRVPDPTDKPIAGGRPLPRRLLVAGGVLLLAALAGAVMLVRSPQREPQAAAATPVLAPSATPRPRATRVPAAAPSPSLAPSPSPSATPAGSPSPAASPSGPARPSPSPGAMVAVVRPSVEQVEEGGDVMEEGGDEPVRGSDPRDVDFNGRWDLVHEVQVSRLSSYAGLRLGYRVTLQQEGDRVYGRGRKLSENGVLLPEDRRTPIFVDGHIEGGYVVLNFVEHGAQRSSTGTIRWPVNPGAGALQGRFSSDVAQSSGTSTAHRLR